MKIRKLKANEIDCRVGMVSKDGKGFSLLLYKDARVDRAILDEVYGVENWQNNFEVINGQVYGSVSIWSEDKKQWITKKDVGTESNTEKEKGQASDAFKRACFKLGIGNELYNAPFIWVQGHTKQYNGKWSANVKKFRVDVFEVSEHDEITKLEISGEVDYKWASIYKLNSKPEKPAPKNNIVNLQNELKQAVYSYCTLKPDVLAKDMFATLKINANSSEEQLQQAINYTKELARSYVEELKAEDNVN